jgi:hypothetical protein
MTVSKAFITVYLCSLLLMGSNIDEPFTNLPLHYHRHNIGAELQDMSTKIRVLRVYGIPRSGVFVWSC